MKLTRRGVVAVALLGVAFLPALADEPPVRLLVVPFENRSGVADLDWVGESFSESLTTYLAGPGRTLVSREERLEGLGRLGLPAAAPLSRASLLRLGEEVGAEAIVLGRFSVAEKRCRVRAHWLELDTLVLSPPVEEEGLLVDLQQIQSGLAWQLLRLRDASFSVTRTAFAQRLPSVNVSAFESYVRGLLAGSREQQMRYFVQASKLDPAFAAPAYCLGHLHYDAEEYAQAAQWFQKVPADSRLGREARFQRALSLFRAQQFSAAVEALRPLARALEQAGAWNNLGIFASRQGDAAGAAEAFGRALQLDSENPDLQFNVALHRLRQEQWEEAARALARTLELNPDDTEALFLRAYALERLGRTQEARLVRQQAVGDNPALDLSLGQRQQALDRPWLSLEAPRRFASAARALHVALHVQRGSDLLTRDELAPAQRELTEAILLDPDSYRAHLLLAAVYRRQGQTTEALSELRAALWSHDTVEVRLRLAELYRERSQPEEARAQVRAALALDPDSAQAHALEQQLPAQLAGAQPDED